MNWKLKAKIQNIISLLPSKLSYSIYYWIQRNFGSLKKFNPEYRLQSAHSICKLIVRNNYEVENKVFFEVGTGRAPIFGIAYWLVGAKKIITIDLNPYVKDELVQDTIKYLKDNETRIREIFGSYLCEERFDKLIQYQKKTFSLNEFLEMCSIKYIAPGDAANTNISEESIDYFTSNAVFEHIPPNILNDILSEGNRIIKKDGLFINYIDYSDHFSNSDSSIPAINFLKYTNEQWNKIAGNRYMYMNRLRHDDFINLFKSAGHIILCEENYIDQRSKVILENKTFYLDESFRYKRKEILSIRGSHIVSKIDS